MQSRDENAFCGQAGRAAGLPDRKPLPTEEVWTNETRGARRCERCVNPTRCVSSRAQVDTLRDQRRRKCSRSCVPNLTGGSRPCARPIVVMTVAASIGPQCVVDATVPEKRMVLSLPASRRWIGSLLVPQRRMRTSARPCRSPPTFDRTRARAYSVSLRRTAHVLRESTVTEVDTIRFCLGALARRWRRCPQWANGHHDAERRSLAQGLLATG